MTRRLPDQFSKSESDSEWEIVEPPHTRNRPPNLKESNFSPADMTGPVAGPQSIHSSHSSLSASSACGRQRLATTSNPDSENTDSTVKAVNGVKERDAVTPSVPDRLFSVINHDFDCGHEGAIKPLTEQAMRALNYEYSARPCPYDLSAWVNAGQLPFGGQDQPLDLSSSMMMPESHARTVITSGTSSSWDMVTAPTVQSSDPIAEDVCATGHQFADCSKIPDNISDDLMED
ncbi:hypothetical protein UCREL1_10045 [Eutypa lata UCREL1]|uniref:Uncharacterized protein n=1 Tax=Eutypa lata (strain UCR-EL1) TaxID=1287681 RepID=M7SA45_EUTLA|nr:hypothetical protein UCREL1_10045 [Eutypa lata UCREL1]